MFASIFHYTNFSDLVDEETAKLLAKRADQVLDKHSLVLFGNLFEDGNGVNFSTTKSPTDTHVTLAIGTVPMSAFAPPGAYVKTEAPTDSELVGALKTHNELLKAINKQRKKLDEPKDPEPVGS